MTSFIRIEKKKKNATSLNDNSWLNSLKLFYLFQPWGATKTFPSNKSKRSIHCTYKRINKEPSLAQHESLHRHIKWHFATSRKPSLAHQRAYHPHTKKPSVAPNRAFVDTPTVFRWHIKGLLANTSRVLSLAPSQGYPRSTSLAHQWAPSLALWVSYSDY